MKKIGGKASELFTKLLTFLRKLLFMIISAGPIPDHIGFIMDGNRRYAKKLNAALESGHKAGYSSLMDLLANCYDLGVKHVTVYAFSIDNFKRRPEEVSYLMDLMLEKIEALLEQKSIADKYGIRVYFVGNLKLLEERVRVAAERAMRATAHNSGAVLSVCMAYTSCDEIVNAVRESCREKRDMDKDEKLVPLGMKLGDLERHMYMSASPDPDVVIRSSGEMRLSNFLLWQTGYCPLYSPEALWPELGLWHLVWAVLNYQRSYGYLEKKKRNKKKKM